MKVADIALFIKNRPTPMQDYTNGFKSFIKLMR